MNTLVLAATLKLLKFTTTVFNLLKIFLSTTKILLFIIENVDMSVLTVISDSTKKTLFFLKEEQQKELNYILINYSEELRRGYNEKEELLNIIHSTDKDKIDKLNRWVRYNLDSNYRVLKECATTYSNWIIEIRNSLTVPYSNGVMEGYNNKIKVLKRVAFGFRNFTNFKARILLLN